MLQLGLAISGTAHFDDSPTTVIRWNIASHAFGEPRPRLAPAGLRSRLRRLRIRSDLITDSFDRFSQPLMRWVSIIRCVGQVRC